MKDNQVRVNLILKRDNPTDAKIIKFLDEHSGGNGNVGVVRFILSKYANKELLDVYTLSALGKLDRAALELICSIGDAISSSHQDNTESTYNANSEYTDENSYYNEDYEYEDDDEDEDEDEIYGSNKVALGLDSMMNAYKNQKNK